MALIVAVSVVAIIFVGGGASPAEMKKYIAEKCKQDGVDYNPGPFYSDSLLVKYTPDRSYQLVDINSWLSRRGLDFLELSSRILSLSIRTHFRSAVGDGGEYFVRASLENVGHKHCDYFLNKIKPYSQGLFDLRERGLEAGKCIALELVKNEGDIKSNLVLARDRYVEQGLVDIPWRDVTLKKGGEVLARYKTFSFCAFGGLQGRGCKYGSLGSMQCESPGDRTSSTRRLAFRSVLSPSSTKRREVKVVASVAKYKGGIRSALLRAVEAPQEESFPRDGAIKKMKTGIEFNGFAKFEIPNKVKFVGGGELKKLQISIQALESNSFDDVVSPLKVHEGYLLFLAPVLSLKDIEKDDPLLLVEISNAGNIESLAAVPLPPQLNGWRVPYYQVFSPIEIIDNKLYVNIINRVDESDRGLLHRFEIVADFDFEYD